MTRIPAIGPMYRLPSIHSVDTENILGGIGPKCIQSPNWIFLGCTKITLGRIRIVIEAHIHGSLYHYRIPADGWEEILVSILFPNLTVVPPNEGLFTIMIAIYIYIYIYIYIPISLSSHCAFNHFVNGNIYIYIYIYTDHRLCNKSTKYLLKTKKSIILIPIIS